MKPLNPPDGWLKEKHVDGSFLLSNHLLFLLNDVAESTSPFLTPVGEGILSFVACIPCAQSPFLWLRWFILIRTFDPTY